MYIKSTQENLTNLQDIYNSLDRHLGQEYSDTIKNIINNTNEVTPTEDVEKIEEDYRSDITRLERNSDYYINTFADIDNFCDELITYIQDTKRIDRKGLIKRLAYFQNEIKGGY